MIFGLLIQVVPGQTVDNGGKSDNKATDKEVPAEKDSDEALAKEAAEAYRKNLEELKEQQALNRDRGDERYRIGFQDTLDIQVFRHQELSQTVSVNPDGTIRLFKINNPIVAVCKTERELAFVIESLYKNYLRTPQVNVRAIEQRSQPFAVIGAVEKPGSFFLNKKVRLIQLLALAGGYDVEKAGMTIQVARIGNLAGCLDNPEVVDQNAEVEFLSYNLVDVIKGKQNPWMEPGDIVSVLEAEEAYVVGDVFEPAKVQLKSPTTLMQAIAQAGGLSKNAKTDKVIIQRQTPGSPVKTELAFNLKEIRDRKVEDPYLQANDIIVVSTDKGKAFTSGLLKAFTGGIPNIFYRIPL